MMRGGRLARRFTEGPLGVVTITVTSVLLVSLCYYAVAEWRRAAEVAAGRRARATADMVVTALVRDMRGAQLSLLAPARLDDPSDLHDRMSSGFARFHYPESFFILRDPLAGGTVQLYARGNRYPSWLPAQGDARYLPMVSTTVDPAIARQFADRLAIDAGQRRRFSIFNLSLGGTPYQVVSLLSYADPYRQHANGAFGFMVNLTWVRDTYVRTLTTQIMQAANLENDIAIDLRDERGTSLIKAVRREAGVQTVSRPLRLAFFDPIVADVEPSATPVAVPWSLELALVNDPAVVAARAGSRQTTVLALLAASLSILSYVFMSRTARQSARTAEMRVTFVEGVTHELKTPIATIRAIGETLAATGDSRPELTTRFAALSVEEAKRLTRLIDNLLAYSRVTDVTETYHFVPVQADALITEILRDFTSRLPAGAVCVEVEDGCPPVFADATALRLVLSNLIDNAIRYSPDTPQLRIAVRTLDASVRVEIVDQGVGIPTEELPMVTRKFFRGRTTGSGGSGLGLAIVERIIADHRGTLGIASQVGQGTHVSVTLPVWSDAQDGRQYA